ncbi:MAG: FecR domain-containing protein [Alphaproteobacteria bacterium]|nr:FecR domain-containing protein [Alphaproteobacteria bacterium]
MAYDFFGSSSDSTNILTIDGPTVELPDASYIRDAALERDGMDLVLDGPNGTVTVEGYFAAESAPDLTADGGLVLTPKLVNSFVADGNEYAQSASMNDVSPVGAVDEVNGEATITRTDGSVEKIAMGTHVFQGDVIETSGEGAVNISFIDDTSFAVSNNARLAIDEYVFDPATEAGSQNFSVLKGVFVFTSGLIGRDDPDDVNIDMPSGSIGIRGTIIAGDADSGEVTVVEGAIVVRDHLDNELTLDERFETAKIDTLLGEIQNLGKLAAKDVSDRFDTVSNVSPTLFSSIEDAATEEVLNPDVSNDDNPADTSDPAPTEENFDAEGTVDGDGDSDVDGTVDEGTGEGATGTDETGAVEETADGVTTKEATVQNKLGTEELGDETTSMETELKQAVQDNVTTTNETTTVAPKSSTTTTTQKTVLNTTQEAQDPDTIMPTDDTGGGGGGGGGGAIPVFIRDAQLNNDPDFAPGDRFTDGQTNQPSIEYFRASEGQSFVYDFSNEFLDIGDTLTFSMSNPVDTTGSVGSENITTGGLFSFDTSAIGIDGTFSFDVTATDSGGQSVTESFTVSLQAPDSSLTDASGLGATNNADDYVFTGTTINLGVGGNVTVGNVFLGNGNDALTLSNADSNIIHLGEGTNQVTVSESNLNNMNTIFGGSNSDTFVLQYTGTSTNNFQNTFYGMDGNDSFIMQTNGNMSFSNLTIKGGSGTDTLVIDDTGIPGTLNFADINSGPFTAGDITGLNIHGIENIDMTGGNAFVSLNATNVFEFTDFRNELRIDGDSTGDSLTLSGFVDTGTDSGSYDVYEGSHSGHTVTLLVDQEMAGNVTVL